MRSIAKQETMNKSLLAAAFAAVIAVLLAFAAGSTLVAFADDAEDDAEETAQLSPQAEENSEESSSSVASSKTAVKPQDDPSVKASPTELALVVDGESKTVDLTLSEGITKDDLKLVPSDDDVVECGAITEKDGKISFTVKPVATEYKTTNIKIVKTSDESSPLATVKVAVNKRKVKITAVASQASKVTIVAKDSTDELKAVSSDSKAATYEVTAKQDISYTVSAKGYEDETGTIKSGASDVDEKVELTPTTYKISYKLNGGTNDDGNPSTYNIESKDITLASPTREDYSFTGWTTASQSTPGKTYTIETGTTGDQTFTANWKKLKSGMEVTAKDVTVNYDGKDHSLTVSSSNAKNIDVYYSADKGKTYTEESMAKSDAGEYTIYYKVVDSDQVYASAKGTAKINILETDEASDSATGISAKGDIFKKYTTDHKVVQLSTEDLTNSTSQASHISDLRKKYFDSTKANLFKVYDVSLNLVDTSDDSSTAITSDFGNVVVTFPVDKSLNGKAAHVYEQHVESGKTTEIPFNNLKVSDGKVQIVVNKLSEFVLVVDKTDATTTKAASSSTSGSTAAKTGDTISPVLPVSIAVIALAIIAFAVYRMRKLR